LESLNGIALSELEGWAFHGEIDEIESPETVPRGCKHLSFIIKTASAFLQSTPIYLLTLQSLLKRMTALTECCAGASLVNVEVACDAQVASSSSYDALVGEIHSLLKSSIEVRCNCTKLLERSLHVQ